jgi:hypothetical protein
MCSTCSLCISAVGILHVCSAMCPPGCEWRYAIHICNKLPHALHALSKRQHTEWIQAIELTVDAELAWSADAPAGLPCVTVVTDEPPGVATLRAAKPGAAATPDAWATVLALAALRARLRGEQALWSDWEVRVGCV